MENILEVINLRKNFNKFALKDISFTLPKGYIMGFIGPNGAGKSTTIKLIMNLLKKDGGQIKVFGKDHIQHEKEIKQHIGFVYDESHFYDELTLDETKKFIAPFYKSWDDHVFHKYIKIFQLPLDKKIKELSKGMKMKFSLALALSHDAKLLIMDEPTSGLDPIVRSELLDILYEIIQDEEKSVFFSTHITSDLEKVADYITFIHEGEIVLSMAKDDILDNYCIVKGGIDLLDTYNQKAFVGIRKTQYNFQGLIDCREKVQNLFKGNVIIEKPSLEDIMLYIVRGRQYA
ncbi:MAG: ABC transporter ATP-binding protein [Caldicoprobacterales bacterium]